MQVETAYTAWYWAGTVTFILRLMIIYYFWHAVYANQATIKGMNLKTMISYMVVAMILQGLVSGTGNRLASDIRTGEVAIELMRPYDLIFKIIALDFGAKLSGFIREGLPLIIIGFLFLHISFPATWQSILLFVTSGLVGIGIGAFFDLIIAMLAFWTINVWGLRVLKEAVITFFSGALIPITLFPAWLLHVSMYLPFQSMIFVPVSIYTGTITGMNAIYAIGIQVIWLVGLYMLVRLLWSQALKQITIFGG